MLVWVATLLIQSQAATVLRKHRPVKTESAATGQVETSRTFGETKAIASNESHQLVKKDVKKQVCTLANTIFDLGFYDGGDSRNYLQTGHCVVGIEADPDLVTAAHQNFAGQIATGQLKIANYVVAPMGKAEAWTEFYKSKCTKEWNSFYKTIGCRQCAPPHSLDMTMCTVEKVNATDCLGIFSSFGVPHYMKLDIEGAETGCFQAMKHLPAGQSPPQFVSAEITQLDYIDTLHQLGYAGFKLVRQDHLNTVQSQTGPWGDNATDCLTGAAWRTYAEVHAEFTAALNKPYNYTEKCSGGIMPIHGAAKPASSYIWYDIHARLTVPPAPAR